MDAKKIGLLRSMRPGPKLRPIFSKTEPLSVLTETAIEAQIMGRSWDRDQDRRPIGSSVFQLKIGLSFDQKAKRPIFFCIQTMLLYENLCCSTRFPNRTFFYRTKSYRKIYSEKSSVRHKSALLEKADANVSCTCIINKNYLKWWASGHHILQHYFLAKWHTICREF